MPREIEIRLDYYPESQKVGLIISIPESKLIEFDEEIPVSSHLRAFVEKHWDQAYDDFDKSISAWRGLSSGVASSYSSIGAATEKLSSSLQLLNRNFGNWLDHSVFRTAEHYIIEGCAGEDRLLWLRSKHQWLLRLPWYSWDGLAKNGKKLVVGIRPFNIAPIPSSSVQGTESRSNLLSILGNGNNLDLSQDTQSICNLGEQIDAQILCEPSKDELCRSLRSKPWKVITFSGHSEVEGDSGILNLSGNESITTKDIAYLIEDSVKNGLKLIILNSCKSYQFAQECIQVGLPWAIAMREKVPDLIAQEFIAVFFEKFSTGVSLIEAFDYSRQSLQHRESEVPGASSLPVLVAHPQSLQLSWSDIKPRVQEKNYITFNTYSGRKPVKLKHLVVTVLSIFAISLISSPIGEKLSRWLNDMVMKSIPSESTPSDFHVSLLRVAIILDSDNPYAYYNLGWVLRELGKFNEAKRTLRESHELGFSPASSELMRELLYGGNDMNTHTPYREIPYLFHQCMGNLGTLPAPSLRRGTASSCHKNWGWYLFKNKDYERAVEHLQSAIAWNKDTPMSYCLLAKIYEERGDLRDKSDSQDYWSLFEQYRDSREQSEISFPEWNECRTDQK